MEYPIGGIGCLGAANLANCLVRVVCPCFLGFSWLPCPNCGRFYLDSCPGCGLKLAMAGILVGLLGRPVCGVWFWWFCIGLMPLSLCFRGGAVRLLSYLVAV